MCKPCCHLPSFLPLAAVLPMPGGNVRVMVRVRPMLPRELSYDAAVEVTDPVSGANTAVL
eukprot:1157502-Pelagomonas_calceolata.AAC.2